MYSGNAPADLRAPFDRTASDQLFSYNHVISLGMARDAVRQRYERAQNRCLHDATLHCKLISAVINSAGDAQSSGTSSYAQLVVTLPHDNIAVFEEQLLSPVANEHENVTVFSRSTSTDNVSQEAGDAAKKLARLTDYRDRLTALAKRPNLSVSDLIKIEGEISKAQSDLDEALSQKNGVSERLAKERLSISLSEETGPGDAFRPVGQVWRNAVQLLGESTASALQFLIQVIPWLPLIVGAFFLCRWLWRLARRNSSKL